MSLSHADLTGVLVNGLVNEELLQQIIDVSRLPLPFTDKLGSSSTGNKRYEWTMDRLQAVDVTNAAVDGADVDQNDVAVGQRVSNEIQILIKEVQVSLLGEAADSVASVGRLARQVNRRGQELMRDREAIWLSNQGAQVDDGAAVPGLTGTLGAWIDGKIIVPSETGVGVTDYTDTAAFQTVEVSGTIARGGWEARDFTGDLGGVTPVVFTTVVPGAITETAVNAAILALFRNTGSMANRVGMSRPEVHSRVSAYYFTSSARVATLLSDQGASPSSPVQATGAVNAILTDYGIIDLIPNALMQLFDVADSTPDSDAFYILDFSSLENSNMTGFRVENLAKTGLAEKRLLSMATGFKPLATESQGVIHGIDQALAMTA